MAVTFKLLATSSWTNNSSTLTLSSIPQTYDDLYVHIMAKNNSPAGRSNINMRINGLSTTIYAYRNMYILGTTVGTSRSNSGDTVIGIAQGFAHNAYSPAHTIIYLPSYKDTNWRRICMYWVNNTNAANNADQSMTEGMGQFNTEVAINSLSFINGDGNVTSSNSFVKLYGISRTV